MTLISKKSPRTTTIKAFKTLYSYLESDSKVFDALDVNKRLIKVLNFTPHLLPTVSEDERQAAIKVALFFIQRYQLDYEDFSSDSSIIA